MNPLHYLNKALLSKKMKNMEKIFCKLKALKIYIYLIALKKFNKLHFYKYLLN